MKPVNMKILYFVHQFFPLHFTGGTERYTLETAKAVAKAGHDVQIVAYQYSTKAQRLRKGIDDFQYESLPVREIYFSPPFLPRRLKTEYRNPSLVPYLERTIEGFEPDVAHVMHCLNFSGYLLKFLSAESIPTVVTLTDYWFLCPRIQLLRPNGEICSGPSTMGDCLKCAFRRLNFYPIIEKTPDFFFNWIAKTINYDRIAFMKSALESVNIVITPTRFSQEIFKRNGFNTENFLVSPYGIDISWRTNKKSTYPSEKVRIGYIGALVRQKGVHILIDAFRGVESENLELLIYGRTHDKIYYDYLVKLAAEDRRIKFLGTFHIEKMGEVLSEMDALCVPSVWNDYPLVIYSSFAMKVPVIASDIESLKEIVISDANGLVFERGNIGHLRRILKSVSEEPSILAALSRNIKKVKTIEENADELIRIYESLTDSAK